MTESKHLTIIIDGHQFERIRYGNEFPAWAWVTTGPGLILMGKKPR